MTVHGLTSGVGDEDEGMDLSSEPIRWELEKTLQHAEQGLSRIL